MKNSAISLFFVLTLVTVGAAQGQDSNVALVTLLSGDVTYVSRSGMPDKVKPFMKVRDGDRINVAVGGQIRIAYFEGSRQELWSGPAIFRARKSTAELISGKAAEISNLPTGVPQRMARISGLIKFAKLGGMRVRGISKHKEKSSLDRQTTLAQARSAYETMRQEMPADDITPELYLYAAMYEFRLYDEMKVVVEEMRRKQADNQDVKALDSWLSSRMSR